ncbi:centrosomal protein of 104 kDa-like [Dendronephthya gigantea]|uniref:centrosomal protein of 104 kDa-like n=1 Tax=Dendronephthya gigantea TaxID=151771 RepID=UPI00106913D1|nr:centrosomal protein of 104 kDa-like [Dendronephthya gigantea]
MMARKVPFKVVHASGADDGYSAKELETHAPTTKGWRTSKFCVYPQEVILMLQQSMRIRKLQILSHQYLIPTKIEVFIGSIPEGQSSSLLTCKFKRLGHVSLVDNQNTEYKSRELKSVHLDAHGQFIKLFVHKNYVNKFNLYNQVQIIATNIIAESIETFSQFDDANSADRLVDQYMKQENVMPGDPLWGKINKPDHISPLDDIAFAMYQDPQTAEIIRDLEQKKKDAIKEDEFVEAKKYHQVVNDLHKVGERLGRLNVEKQRAIEVEDYDLAMVKKQQIDEYRKVVTDRLVSAGIIQEPNKEAPVSDRNANRAPPSTNRFSMSPPLPPITTSPQPDSRPEVPASAKSPYVSPRPSQDKVEIVQPPSMSPEQITAADDRPLPTMTKKDTPDPIEQSPPGVSPPSQDGPSELREKDAREATLAIDIFGEHVVRCIYTKQWTYRKQGMDTIKRELSSENPELIAEHDARSVVRAVVDLLKKGIIEQVHPVFVLSLSILKDLLTIFIPKHEAQNEISFVLQKTVPLLLLKTGEMAARMKNSAMEFIIEISQYEDVKTLGVIPDLTTHPFKNKQQGTARLYTGRIELIEKLLAVLGLDETTPNGFSTASTMKFILPALENANGGVRDAAVKLIFELYKLKAPVKGFLPADEPATRKNPLYRSIFDGFDRIDGKPTEAERKAKAKNDRETAEKAKQKEIDELHAHLQALREMAAKQGNAEEEKKTDQSAVDSSNMPEPSDVDRMCIFCGIKDETFTEEVLDTHYWKSCPMLKRCPKCSQVIEICRQSQHLLEECESKANFVSCPRCREAVPKLELNNHSHDKVCPKKSGNRCPLCRKAVDSSEEAWRVHLTKQCQPNTKRLQQLKQQGNKMPPFASMTSLRAKGTKGKAAAGKTTRNTSKSVPRKDKVNAS